MSFYILKVWGIHTWMHTHIICHHTKCIFTHRYMKYISVKKDWKNQALHYVFCFCYSFCRLLVLIYSLEKRGQEGSMNRNLRKHSETRAVPANCVMKLWGHVWQGPRSPACLYVPTGHSTQPVPVTYCCPSVHRSGERWYNSINLGRWNIFI